MPTPSLPARLGSTSSPTTWNTRLLLTDLHRDVAAHSGVQLLGLEPPQRDLVVGLGGSTFQDGRHEVAALVVHAEHRQLRRSHLADGLGEVGEPGDVVVGLEL